MIPTIDFAHPTYDRRFGAPLYWRDEVGGELSAAMMAYVNHAAWPKLSPEPTPEQLVLVIAYLKYAINAQPRECFRNAAMALFAYRCGEPATYVEGLLVIMDGALPIVHGWLEVGGCIVDPTLVDEDAADYHAVFRYGREDVDDLVHMGKGLPYFAITYFGRRKMLAAEWALWELEPYAAA